VLPGCDALASGTGGLGVSRLAPALGSPSGAADAPVAHATNVISARRSAADRILIPRHCSQAFGVQTAPFATVTEP
jgi:hypothetical protein